MSSHPIRTSFSLAVIAFSTMAVGTADAKECKTDQDCASGFECYLGTKSSGGTGGSTGSIGGGGAGVGAATGTACAGPDCPVTSPGMPQPVPVDAGAAVPLRDLPPPQVVDGGAPLIVARVTDAGPITPVETTGICQLKPLVCTSKADCPANLDCVKDNIMVKRPACAPNTICDTPLPVSETGLCKAVCNVDSDCPAPLVCKLQGASCTSGASRNADGTVTTLPTTCTGGNKMCTFQPVVCTTDAPCSDADYQCVKVSESQMCSGSAPAGCPKSTDGTADVYCPTTPPEPPVCTSTVVNNCMPKKLACDAGQACPAGWSCFDFENFETVIISGWTEHPYGKACLPDGFIMGIYGTSSGSAVRNTAGYGNSGSETQGGTGTIGVDDKGGGPNGVPTTNTGDTTPPQVTPVPASDGQEHATAGDAGAEAASTKVRGGGCSLGGAQDSAFSLLAFGLIGLVLRLVRRRR